LLPFLIGELKRWFFGLMGISRVIEHLSFEDAEKTIDYLWSLCDGQMIVETPNEYEDGEAYVAESQNNYQRHLSLIDKKFMKSKGFNRIFIYFQPSGFSNSIYLREK
jgi:hypothetical protein